MPLRAIFSSNNFLDELQQTLEQGTVARRVEALRRVTDLFVDAEVDYSDEQISLFDDVFQLLISHIEASAKVALANRLAPVKLPPPQTVRTLAFDDHIEVASPILSKCERLDDETLVQAANSKSQEHLRAISIRRVLSRTVTDVLVLRGSDEVVQSAMNNPGAEFSEGGFTQLVKRAENNETLATCVGSHPTLPRHLYLRLIAKASDAVRSRLEAANPPLANEIPAAVRKAARSSGRAMTEQTIISHGLVKSLFEDGRLDEKQMLAFAEERKFDETNAGIAALANVNLETAETIMIETRTEGVMILAKVARLSWPTVRAILQMREAIGSTERSDLDALRRTYEQLRLATAQQVLRFHRMQQAAVPAL